MKSQVNIDVANSAKLYGGKEFQLQETGTDKIVFFYFSPGMNINSAGFFNDHATK
jgi:hypothetical protein